MKNNLLEDVIKELAGMIANEMKIELSTFLIQNNEKKKSDEEWMTIKEASIYYRKHKNTIRSWVKKGELKSKRIGSVIYIKKK